VADSAVFFPISTANVDIFVDKGHLTAQTALNRAVPDKVPVQKADFISFKINNLDAQVKTGENLSSHFLITNFCA
jgi:hypothetical protein